MMDIIRTITPAMIDFGRATPVISSAQKFVVPVPRFTGGGEDLVYPTGDPRAGSPIVDWKNNPIGQKGVVFFNGRDKAWQAAASNGESVIIINQVTVDQARELHLAYQSLGSPDCITLESFKGFLRKAQQMSLVDMYNSDLGFIAKKMTPVLAGEFAISVGATVCGLLKRDDGDICRAVFVQGAFIFQGTVAAQVFEDGGVVLQQGEEVRGLQSDVFLNTYRSIDGRRFTDLAHEVSIQQL